nr:hypothetical protein CFP56_27948 [Quercus suber]
MRVFCRCRGLTPGGGAKEAQTAAGGCLSRISAAAVARQYQQRQLLFGLSSDGSTMGFVNMKKNKVQEWNNELLNDYSFNIPRGIPEILSSQPPSDMGLYYLQGLRGSLNQAES